MKVIKLLLAYSIGILMACTSDSIAKNYIDGKPVEDFSIVRVSDYQTIGGLRVDASSINSWNAGITNLSQLEINLSSTTPGNEGIRLIGAFGGYDLEEFFEDTYLSGPSRDKPTWTYSRYPVANLNISYTDGDVYSPSHGYFKLIDGTKTLTDNANNYAYWNTNTPTIIQWAGSRPTGDSIILARFTTAMGAIISVDETRAIGEAPLDMLVANADIIPSLVITPSGILAYSTGTALSNVAMTAGFEYQDMINKMDHYPQDLSNTNLTTQLLAYSKTNGNYIVTYTNIVPVGYWGDGTNVVACDTNLWYRGLFLSKAENREMHWVYPQAAYTSEVAAFAGSDPVKPTGFEPYVISSTAYIFKGNETGLSLDTSRWIDRRTMIRAGASSGSGGGSAATPALSQVMAAGSSLAGILPHDAPLPTDPDELASKEYVDSTINNVNSGKAYVDTNGDDLTAQVESSILTFKTIQAAIDACVAVATDSNRYVVCVSPGHYDGNLTMKNYIGLQGIDTEATKINGYITFPPSYTDITGTEIQLITVAAENSPVITFNLGADDAYAGIRSCYFISNYDDNSITNKSLITMNRGLVEIYGTTYNELNVNGTNTETLVGNEQIYEHFTDPSNDGLSQLISHSASSVITSKNTRDNVSIFYNYNNLDNKCFNILQGGVNRIFLDNTDEHSNTVSLVRSINSKGVTLCQGKMTKLELPSTNSVKIVLGYISNSADKGLITLKDNNIRVICDEVLENVFFGSATSTNDNIKIINTTILTGIDPIEINYPERYIDDGSDGNYDINTACENGDTILGGPIDMSDANSSNVLTPSTGHLKVFQSPYAGLENLMLKDSSGNVIRLARDNFYNGYNGDVSDLAVGEAVYFAPGISSNNTPIVKRCIASDISTMPCIGMVSQVGGIATGSIGRIMVLGRLETPFNTSSFSSGDKLYVSATVAGGITNVAPTGTNIVQMIGNCHISSTNGHVNVRPWRPDTLGGLTASSYALATNVNSSFKTTYELVSSPTVTVTRAMGNELSLFMTNNVQITYSELDFPTNGVSRFGMSLYKGAFTLTIDTNLIDSVSFGNLTISTNAWNYIIFNKGFGQTKAEVR